MQHLFNNRIALKRDLINRHIILFLDYDGTLTPIVGTPDKAVISPKSKILLKKLSQSPNCSLAIISGRGLSDVKKKVGLKGIIYAGNHGLQIKAQGIRLKNPVSSKSKVAIQRINKELAKRLFKFKGVLVEDKGITLSLHYRLAKAKELPLIKQVFAKITTPYLTRGQIKITSGKKVFEVRPPIDWDKGKAVLWFLKNRKFISKSKNILPVFIGDDTTDEDAFKALKNKGLAIFVGKPKESYAPYYLKNSNEVFEFFKMILCLQK